MTYLNALLNDQSFNLKSEFIDIIELDRGILKLSPKNKTSSKVLLSCGIHGNETAPIEIVDDILRDLISGQQKLDCELMLIFGSIPGMKKASRYLDFNLNRLFSGVWKSHPHALESKRAQLIEKYVTEYFNEKSRHCIHLDLHTALFPSKHLRFAIIPHKEKTTTDELSSLSSLGLDALCIGSTEKGTFSYYTQTLIKEDGHSATIELGKVMPFGQNNRKDFSIAEKSLRTLVATGRLPQEKVVPTYHIKRELIRDHENYVLHLEDNFKNFTLLDPNKPLEKSLRGTTYPNTNEYLIFPNEKVKIGQRSGLILNLQD